MLIQTGSGYVCPDEVQIEGKKRMKTSDFLRGYVIKSSFLK
jgi:methionyl-tRNA formyltransferase